MKFVILQHSAFALLLIALPALLVFLLMYVAIDRLIKKLFRQLSQKVYVNRQLTWEMEEVLN